jgi:tripartite-type tricarboxylate transporter receptor subunit TctC
LHQEIVKVIHRPDMKEMLLRGGVEPLGSTPKELADYVELDLNRITKMLAATGFKGKQP